MSDALTAGPQWNGFIYWEMRCWLQNMTLAGHVRFNPQNSTEEDNQIVEVTPYGLKRRFATVSEHWAGEELHMIPHGSLPLNPGKPMPAVALRRETHALASWSGDLFHEHAHGLRTVESA